MDMASKLFTFTLHLHVNKCKFSRQSLQSHHNGLYCRVSTGVHQKKKNRLDITHTSSGGQRKT